jgi:hypothetical protein
MIQNPHGRVKSPNEGSPALVRAHRPSVISMPVSPMLPLRFGHGLGPIKSIIKVSVDVIHLKPEHGAERRGMRRKAAIAIMDVLAICNRCLDGGLADVQSSCGHARWIAPCAMHNGAMEDPLGAKLALDHLAHCGLHRRIVRRTVGGEEAGAIVLNAQDIGDREVAPQDARRRWGSFAPVART